MLVQGRCALGDRGVDQGMPKQTRSWVGREWQESQNPWADWVGRTINTSSIQFQLPCCGQSCQPVHLDAWGLWHHQHRQGWGSHNFSGLPVPHLYRASHHDLCNGRNAFQTSYVMSVAVPPPTSKWGRKEEDQRKSTIWKLVKYLLTYSGSLVPCLHELLVWENRKWKGKKKL